MALEVTDVRKHAEETTSKQYEEQEKALLLLSADVANEKKPVSSRQQSGLLLRDALYAKEDHIRFTLTDLWRSLDVRVQTEIINNLLLTLESCVVEARITALQVIAVVGFWKLSHEEWLKHIGPLLPSSNQVWPDVRSLETLGYVSRAFAFAGDKQILEAIVEGMKASNDVRLAATRALHHALGLDQEKITKDIMEAVCDAAVSTDVKIQQAAFECLLLISSRYYEDLAPYVEQILDITRKAVKQQDKEETVALQAIEIWSSFCSRKFDSLVCFNYIKQAVSGLVPILLEALRKQEENQDDGAWNLAMAGRRCLRKVARIVGDAIVPLVTPFVEENIKKPDWRQREAATYALGTILLRFPTQYTLAPLHVKPTVSLMLTTLIEDPNNLLKDTTAWTLGNIFGCFTVSTPIVTPAYCQYIITVLLRSMKKDAPNVAEKACGALYDLLYLMKDLHCSASSFHQIVLAILTEVTKREDAGFRSAACKTLVKALECSTDKDLLQLLPIIKKDFEETLEEQNKQNEMRRRELLCWFLGKIFPRLVYTSSFKQQHADVFMNLLFRALACPGDKAREEAMLAVANLAYAIGPDHFVKHMPEFSRFLEKKLQNLEGSPRRECKVTLDVVGRIFKILKDKAVTWSESVMRELLGRYDQVDISVKPLVLSCFGDIATGIKDGFSVYHDPVSSLIERATAERAKAACQFLSTGVRDDEMMEHTINLNAAAIAASSYIERALKC